MDDSSVYKPTLQTMYQYFERVCVCLCVTNEVGGSVGMARLVTCVTFIPRCLRTLGRAVDTIGEQQLKQTQLLSSS